MASPAEQTIIDLEKKFWQSMIDQDTDVALGLLSEPALMVSSHGAMKFGHEQYRQMAEKGTMIVTAYEMRDVQVVFPNDDTAIMLYGVKQQVQPRGNGGGAITQQMNDTSTWVRTGGAWKCVMHTETPAAPAPK